MKAAVINRLLPDLFIEFPAFFRIVRILKSDTAQFQQRTRFSTLQQSGWDAQNSL
jgi:hypothetical protein